MNPIYTYINQTHTYMNLIYTYMKLILMNNSPLFIKIVIYKI